MNFHLWVIFLKTVNNYIDNQFMWSTVTPGFKIVCLSLHWSDLSYSPSQSLLGRILQS